MYGAGTSQFDVGVAIGALGSPPGDVFDSVSLDVNGVALADLQCQRVGVKFQSVCPNERISSTNTPWHHLVVNRPR